MAPERLNQELANQFPVAIDEGLARRRAGREGMEHIRARLARLIATLSDTHDWSPESRAQASGIFLYV